MVTREGLLDLKRQIVEHYRKRLEAIDLLLQTLPQLDEPSPSPLRMVENPRPRRVRGVLAIVRQLVPQLSQPFDRRQVLEKLQEVEPELAAKVTLANLRNTLRLLAREGSVVLVEEPTSLRPARYAAKKVA